MAKEFGKRDIRKNAEMQSRPLWAPASGPAPAEPITEKTKSMPSGLILKVIGGIGGGAVLALVALWISAAG